MKRLLSMQEVFFIAYIYFSNKYNIVEQINKIEVDSWVEYINMYEGDVEDAFGCDYWEWLYRAGNTVDIRIKMYLLGLRSISKELNKQEETQKQWLI